MKFEDTRTILVTSRPDDWNVVKGGPTFLDDVAPLEADEAVRTHHSVAAYRPDVRLTLAWGMYRELGSIEWWDDESDDHLFFYADVIFCGALIDRHQGVYIDNRYLPNPTRQYLTEFEIGERDPMVGWSATRWEVDFFRLLHSFEDTFDSYDEGLMRANFVVDES